MAEVQVDALKTPALKDGEFADATSDVSKRDGPKKHTALQIAQSLEAKIHELGASLDKDEKALSTRLTAMSSQIDDLLKKIKT
ncbi:hypothetical protein JCM33374_g4174 [Metschnikowia sp. JCM 33374]|nr:hypothetical protein JCM33374_g4174 [Metschnikowia sp. JCM 33374]